VLADVHGRQRLREYMDRVPGPVCLKPSSKISLTPGVDWIGLPFDPYAEAADPHTEGTWLLVRSGTSGSMFSVGKEGGDLLVALGRPLEYRRLRDAMSVKWGKNARQTEKSLRGMLPEFVARGIVTVA
jgi:hypothetical protein